MANQEKLKQMVVLLAEQRQKLYELELKLQKEKQDKANLLVDFQHLLDQLTAIRPEQSINNSILDVAY